jgi:hypothetical protein
MTKRDSFLLRLSPATLDALRRWADDEFRSVNSQIEMVLQKALRDAGRIETTGKDRETSSKVDPDLLSSPPPSP